MSLLRLYREGFRRSPQFAELQKAFGNQATLIEEARDDLFRQLHVDTATWGLVLYENAYGISVNNAVSISDRRTRIKSKMRGVGVTTVDVLRDIAADFNNGRAVVQEFPAEYRFLIRLINPLGLPPGLDSLRAAIEELKPAHLAYDIHLVEQTLVAVPQPVKLSTGVHKKYVIPVQWSVHTNQPVPMSMQNNFTVQQGKNYRIKVK